MLEIRQYSEADHDEVWNLHNVALNQVGSHVGNGVWDDDLHHIQAVYFDNNGEFLVGICDNLIVAMGAFRNICDKVAEITRMRVLPAYQGRGFGRTILQELERRAIKQGYTRLHLDTSTGQIVAQQLYLHNGFKETRRAFIEGFNCIVYEKEIG